MDYELLLSSPGRRLSNASSAASSDDGDGGGDDGVQYKQFSKRSGKRYMKLSGGSSSHRTRRTISFSSILRRATTKKTPRPTAPVPHIPSLHILPDDDLNFEQISKSRPSPQRAPRLSDVSDAGKGHRSRTRRRFQRGLLGRRFAEALGQGDGASSDEWSSGKTTPGGSAEDLRVHPPGMVRDVSTESHPDSLVEAPSEEVTSPVPPVTPVTCSEFLQIVEEVKLAIAEGIYPVRIAKGSSGSYFCYSRKREIVGVFKPKNEEPYGQMNPKWVKWAHRTFLPCCFGRSCIIPNLGYLSEAAASYLDRRLGLNVVPRTEVVILSSPSFHYGRQDIQSWKSGKPLPGKMGSFQLFLKGFKDATEFFKQGYDRLGVGASNAGPSTTIDIDVVSSNQHSSTGVWSDQMKREFQWGFERLVCLDYLIRNTDRGLDNWMVKQSSSDSDASASTQSTSTQPHVSVQVAGIDNGLAFPHKHPDHFRSYPFGWTLLPCAHVSFSAETRGYILHHLTSEQWWRETVHGFRQLFAIDPDFDSRMFSRQMGVVRGQGYNLVEVLRRAELAQRSGVTGTRQSIWNAQATPAALAKRPVVCVYEEEVDALPDPPMMLSRMNSPRIQGASTVKRFESFDTVKPVFRSW